MEERTDGEWTRVVIWVVGLVLGKEGIFRAMAEYYFVK